MVYNNALELIGNTPLVRLSKIEEKLGLKAKIFAKVEYFNTTGSVKDRIAFKIISEMEKDGRLVPGSTLIEPTSGNTGIGISCVAAVKGYRCIIVMPSTMSAERVKLMKAYGAEVVLSDGKLGMSGAIEEANRLNKEIENSFIVGQFVNLMNPQMHYETTGPEIYKDLDGKVDILVGGIGTGGTITGTGKFLKSKIHTLKVVGLEPATSAILSGQPKGPHKIQGIGAGFEPLTLDKKILDEILTISNEEAYEYTRLVAKTEGLLVGISSGAALRGAVIEASKEENEGKTIVVIFPDSGDRYLSVEGLF